MWLNPFPTQSFALCAADGTVLAELPPTMRFDGAIGKPEDPKALEPRTNTDNQSGDVAGTKQTSVTEVTTLDYYSYERAPFSSKWIALGDGLPKEKPPAASSTTITTITDDQTVSETVAKTVELSGNQQTTITTTAITTTPKTGVKARYIATPAYWGSVPTAPLLSTNDIQAAYMAAYNYAQQTGQPGWVVEWQSSNNSYSVLDKLEAAAPPQIVLTGNWYYGSGDEALAHAAEIEKACLEATQLMARGRTIATFQGLTPNLFQMKTADRLRDVTYTLTLYTTEYFTADLFMRRQLQ